MEAANIFFIFTAPFAGIRSRMDFVIEDNAILGLPQRKNPSELVGKLLPAVGPGAVVFSRMAPVCANRTS
jgi:hypothetical protein